MRKRYFFRVMLFLIGLGGAISCKKESMPPIVSTIDVKGITQNAANCGGVIVSDGKAKITERGLCWSTGLHPSVDNNKLAIDTKENEFSGILTGLSPFTTYFVRAYATNKQGTAYGEIKMFSTEKIPGETVYDIDGNLYHTITIGSQVWLLENLKTARFQNGDSIKNIKLFYQWFVATPAFCSYNNADSNVTTYGLLYNWYAVNDSRGLAPFGWHVPSNAEWQVLIDYCGGDAIAGNKLKEAGFIHWDSPNTGATNESGFTALPAGYRYYDGEFGGVGNEAIFWTATQFNANAAFNRDLQYNTTQVMNGTTSNQLGASVRCIKD